MSMSKTETFIVLISLSRHRTPHRLTLPAPVISRQRSLYLYLHLLFGKDFTDGSLKKKKWTWDFKLKICLGISTQACQQLLILTVSLFVFVCEWMLWNNRKVEWWFRLLTVDVLLFSFIHPSFSLFGRVENTRWFFSFILTQANFYKIDNKKKSIIFNCWLRQELQ